MSARVVVNLSHGLASSAIDRDPDGDNWLSLWQLDEVVVVKLSRASTHALWLALSKDLGMLDARAVAPEGGDGCGAPGGQAVGAEVAGYGVEGVAAAS